VVPVQVRVGGIVSVLVRVAVLVVVAITEVEVERLHLIEVLLLLFGDNQVCPVDRGSVVPFLGCLRRVRLELLKWFLQAV
jgi:hypothetical protein